MSSSRRSFLFGVLGAGGAAALGTTGCVQRVDPAPVTDGPDPANGKVFLRVDRYPDLNVPGGSVSLRLKGVDGPVLVTQRDAGVFAATAATCTHKGCPLGYVATDRALVCPCHGSRFDPASGAVINPPAVQGLRRYDTTFDAVTGELTIDLLGGDPNFPALVDGKLFFGFDKFPQLKTAGGSAAGVPSGVGAPVVVIALADGTYSALNAICTHQGCTVAYAQASGDMQCPCHGSVYTAAGANVSGPAPRPLTRYVSSADGAGVTVKVA